MIALQSETYGEYAALDSYHKVIGGRQGQGALWILTGDAFGEPDMLNAEYIMDGTQIKINTGVAGQVAGQLANDIVHSNPSFDPLNPDQLTL